MGGVVYDSVVDGYGLRNTIFFSGCRHYCKNCHNQQLWDFNYGDEFDEERQNAFIRECYLNPVIEGITLSGGDPMFLAKEIYPFTLKYKEKNPHHTIWIYSGFLYEQILKDEDMFKLLSVCDVLVDGLYDENLNTHDLLFRGSSNQRVIDIPKSLEKDEIVLYEG